MEEFPNINDTDLNMIRKISINELSDISEAITRQWNGLSTSSVIGLKCINTSEPSIVSNNNSITLYNTFVKLIDCEDDDNNISLDPWKYLYRGLNVEAIIKYIDINIENDNILDLLVVNSMKSHGFKSRNNRKYHLMFISTYYLEVNIHDIELLAYCTGNNYIVITDGGEVGYLVIT